MQHSSIITDALEYVHFLNQKHQEHHLYYHNWKHTMVVFHASEKIATLAKLTPYEKEILLLSALFHDMGCYINYYDHEVHSAELAVSFLESYEYAPASTAHVKEMIIATQLFRKPQNKLEMLMRDADLAGLGSDPELFAERLLMLKKEWEFYLDETAGDKEWIALNIEFMQKHHYLSKEANKLFGGQKQLNLKWLKKMLVSSTEGLQAN